MIVSPAAAPDGLHEPERLPQHLLLGLGGVDSVMVFALFGRRRGKLQSSGLSVRWDGTTALYCIA